MDFLKKHYEKVLLGLVLLGLVAAVTFMLFKIGGDKQKLEDLRNSYIRKTAKPLTNLDLTVPEHAFKRVATMAVIDFTSTNRLFNPMAWVKTADGRLIPSTQTGPSSLVVSNIIPLYLKLTFESVSIAADNTPKYLIGIEKQAARRVSDQAKRTTYVKLNEKLDTFKLVGVGGPPENPTNVVMESTDTGDRITVPKDPPYKRVDGYLADLKYPPQPNRNLDKQRIGATINLNGEDYKIVAINQNEVILISPNQRKWTIKATPAPKTNDPNPNTR
jgi:hypothetical protein